MNTLHEIVNTNRKPAEPAKEVICKDGFRISVQASRYHYCLDALGYRPDFLDHAPATLPFTAVECGFPTERPEPWSTWEEYADDAGEPTGTVYWFVPVSLVADLIERHGGEA